MILLLDFSLLLELLYCFVVLLLVLKLLLRTWFELFALNIDP